MPRVGYVRRLRHKIWARRIPRIITLTDFSPAGVRFEASNAVELYRIVNVGYEPEYLAAMLEFLRPDDVLYDIGANIGLVALHAAATCRTVAFEPDPAFYERLQRNLALNPQVSVDARRLAVADSDEQVELFTDGAAGNSPSLIRQRNERSSVLVEARTLDSLIDTGALIHPTVLKLDIEGAEILALRGAEGLLRGPRAPRGLLLEIHDSLLSAFDSSPEEVLDLVHAAGYGRIVYEARRSAQRHLIVERQEPPASA